jgi:hypothetical protein
MVAIGVLGLVLGFQGWAGAATAKPLTTPAVSSSRSSLTEVEIMAIIVGVLALVALGFLVRIFARRRAG